MQGWLISFEGLDGVRKTTQVGRVQEWLQHQGYRVKIVREPGGTPWGEAIRDVLLHHTAPRDATAEFLLFAAARAELVRTVILPWLENGGIILADRYCDSSEAYQGWGGGGNLPLIRQVNTTITALAQPWLTFWLDGPSHLAVDPFDVIESRGAEFFNRVQHGYHALADREPERIVRINAHAHPDVVFAHLCAPLQRMIQTLGSPTLD